MSISEDDLQIGSIFWWNRFQYKQQGGAIKARWLILLAQYREDIFETDHINVFVTTTTQKDPTKLDSKAAMVFSPPRFAQDCYIYFDDKLYALSCERQIRPHFDDIDLVGTITPEEMRRIYLGYFASRIERKFLMDKWRASLANAARFSALDLPLFK